MKRFFQYALGAAAAVFLLWPAPVFATSGAEVLDRSTARVCREMHPGPPAINIQLVTLEPDYDLTTTAKQLTSPERNAAWLRKNKLDALWTPDDFISMGTAMSGWEIISDFRLQGKPIDLFGSHMCPYMRSINIDILMRTHIKIAKELKQGTCAFDAVHAHELKHFQVNKYIVEQAVEKLRADYPVIIRDLEGQGGVPSAYFKTRTDHIKGSLEDVVRVYMRDTIRAQMRELNGQVDTPAEYERVSQLMKVCTAREKAMRRMKPEERQKLMDSIYSENPVENTPPAKE